MHMPASLSPLSSTYKTARRLFLRRYSISAMTTQSSPPSLPSSTSTSCKTVLASTIASPFSSEVKATISNWTSRHHHRRRRRPKLVGFLIGINQDSSSIAYAEWTRKACQDVGIDYELRRVGDIDVDGDGNDDDNDNGNDSNDSSGEGGGGKALAIAKLETAILDANDDDSINGIMVYYPTGAGQRQDSYIQQVVTKEKDVEVVQLFAKGSSQTLPLTGLNFSYLFNLYHNIREIDPRTLSLSLAHSAKSSSLKKAMEDQSGPLIKSILPCTPLAIVKVLEHVGVYDKSRSYGERAYGKVITIINRSEVVGRPLAALLANDGARVLSIDLDGIQEFNRRRRRRFRRRDRHSSSSTTTTTTTIDRSSQNNRNNTIDDDDIDNDKTTTTTLLPHHEVSDSKLSYEECLNVSDIVISGVPNSNYKIPTHQLKHGLVAINFSSIKNFEVDDGEEEEKKNSSSSSSSTSSSISVKNRASIYIPSVGKLTIVLLQRNLLRLMEYQEILASPNPTEAAEHTEVNAK